MTQQPITDADWRERLTPEQFRVLREAGTEAAFSGEYVDTETDGVYKCAACGHVLFDSGTKFHSGSGWPSFYQPAENGAIEERQDNAHGMRRVEVVCSNCGGHLGHVFNDGPNPTGMRYCINSAALQLDERDS